MTTTSSDVETGAPPSRESARSSSGIVVLLWVAKLVAAGILGYASILKLISHEHEVEIFTQLAWEPHGRFLIGGMEIVSAIMILVPQSTLYGAFLGLGVMFGAMIGHLTVLGLAGIHLAVLVAVCCVIILYIRRHDATFIRNLWDR